jgi:hypothetical protein
MSTQYRLVQSGKTASGSCSAGQGSSEPVAPRKKKYINMDLENPLFFTNSTFLEDNSLLAYITMSRHSEDGGSKHL